MLKIKADPTFKAGVRIPTAGGKVHTIEMEFRHMTADEFREFMSGEASVGRSDVDTVLALAVGWSGVDAPFNRESLEVLFQHHIAAPREIGKVFAEELLQAREKN